MNRDSRDTLSLADRLLLEHGELDPFECLLGLGFIDPADYEDWRHRRRPDLQSALRRPVDEAFAALEQAQAYVLAQGLRAETRTPRAWSESPNDLDIGPSAALMQACTRHMARPGERAQGDLFQDSAQSLAVQAIKTALAEHSFDAASEAIERLRRIAPAGSDIEDYRYLIEVVAPSSSTPAERLRELEESIAPLALRRLGAWARDYLTPLWADLAQRLAGVPFSPAAPQLHASYAWARAYDWPQVAQVIETEAHATEHALLLARLAESYARRRLREKARSAWTRLYWEHPQEAPALLAQSTGDPWLAQRWWEFAALDPELAPNDFPAWLLFADLKQRDHVPPALAPDNAAGQVYEAVHRLVETDGELSARVALHALRPDLLKLYLARFSR